MIEEAQDIPKQYSVTLTRKIDELVVYNLEILSKTQEGFVKTKHKFTKIPENVMKELASLIGEPIAQIGLIILSTKKTQGGPFTTVHQNFKFVCIQHEIYPLKRGLKVFTQLVMSQYGWFPSCGDEFYHQYQKSMKQLTKIAFFRFSLNSQALITNFSYKAVGDNLQQIINSYRLPPHRQEKWKDIMKQKLLQKVGIISDKNNLFYLFTIQNIIFSESKFKQLKRKQLERNGVDVGQEIQPILSVRGCSEFVKKEQRYLIPSTCKLIISPEEVSKEQRKRISQKLTIRPDSRKEGLKRMKERLNGSLKELQKLGKNVQEDDKKFSDKPLDSKKQQTKSEKQSNNDQLTILFLHEKGFSIQSILNQLSQQAGYLKMEFKSDSKIVQFEDLKHVQNAIRQVLKKQNYFSFYVLILPQKLKDLSCKIKQRIEKLSSIHKKSVLIISQSQSFILNLILKQKFSFHKKDKHSASAFQGFQRIAFMGLSQIFHEDNKIVATVSNLIQRNTCFFFEQSITEKRSYQDVQTSFQITQAFLKRWSQVNGHFPNILIIYLKTQNKELYRTNLAERLEQRFSFENNPISILLINVKPEKNVKSFEGFDDTRNFQEKEILSKKVPKLFNFWMTDRVRNEETISTNYCVFYNRSELPKEKIENFILAGSLTYCDWVNYLEVPLQLQLSEEFAKLTSKGKKDEKENHIWK